MNAPQRMLAKHQQCTSILLKLQALETEPFSTIPGFYRLRDHQKQDITAFEKRYRKRLIKQYITAMLDLQDEVLVPDFTGVFFENIQLN